MSEAFKLFSFASVCVPMQFRIVPRVVLASLNEIGLGKKHVLHSSTPQGPLEASNQIDLIGARSHLLRPNDVLPLLRVVVACVCVAHFQFGTNGFHGDAACMAGERPCIVSMWGGKVITLCVKASEPIQVNVDFDGAFLRHLCFLQRGLCFLCVLMGSAVPAYGAKDAAKALRAVSVAEHAASSRCNSQSKCSWLERNSFILGMLYRKKQQATGRLNRILGQGCQS